MDVRHGSLLVGGRRRSFLTVRGRVRAPRPALLLMLHGTLQTAANIRPFAGYSFDALAVGRDTVVIYPDAIRQEWNGARKAVMMFKASKAIDDVGFIRALIAHAIADPLAAYDGGVLDWHALSAKGIHLSAEHTAHYFAQRNGITTDPTLTELPHHPDIGELTSVIRRDYTAPEAHLVRFYTVHGGGDVPNNPNYVSTQWFWGPSTRNLCVAAVVAEFFDLPLPSPTTLGES